MEISQDEDRLLFKRIASGDEDAFKTIFQRYRRSVLTYLFRTIKSREDAEELTQEVLLRIWTGRETLGEVESPQDYVFIMARNKAIDYLRKASTNARLRQEIWAAINEHHNPTEEHIFANDSAALVAEAIYKLPPQKQAVFRLSRVEGFTHDQISVQLSISKNTVKNHIVESVKFIRKYIQDH